MQLALGVDVGSVSTNFVLIDESGKVLDKLYLRTRGDPIRVVQQGLENLKESLLDGAKVTACGTTGSGRRLAGHLLGAETVKNEITAHAVAALSVNPQVRTVLEIGGQDSKIILIKDKIVVDFAMNTICAAGTGSFLDRQAARLGVDVSELGDLALSAETSTPIAGRCAVFAESDMVHKQQMGHGTPEIVRGLCESLVHNYLGNVAKGKNIEAPIVFQGGVAANTGIVAAFQNILGQELIVPEHYDVMGALGAALIATRAKSSGAQHGSWRGFSVTKLVCRALTRRCPDCANSCEVVEFHLGEDEIIYWGDRCGKWSRGSGK